MYKRLDFEDNLPRKIVISDTLSQSAEVISSKDASTAKRKSVAKKFQRALASFIDENTLAFMTVALLFMPWFLGFSIRYSIFRIVGGIPLNEIWYMQEGMSHLGVWFIGGHLMIMGGMVWILIFSVANAKKFY